MAYNCLKAVLVVGIADRAILGPQLSPLAARKSGLSRDTSRMDAAAR